MKGAVALSLGPRAWKVERCSPEWRKRQPSERHRGCRSPEGHTLHSPRRTKSNRGCDGSSNAQLPARRWTRTSSTRRSACRTNSLSRSIAGPWGRAHRGAPRVQEGGGEGPAPTQHVGGRPSSWTASMPEDGTQRGGTFCTWEAPRAEARDSRRQTSGRPSSWTASMPEDGTQRGGTFCTGGRLPRAERSTEGARGHGTPGDSSRSSLELDSAPCPRTAPSRAGLSYTSDA